MSDAELFEKVWNRLAEESRCDGPGGAEYERVKREWLEALPSLMAAFICEAANRVPNNEADGIDLAELGREIGEIPDKPR